MSTFSVAERRGISLNLNLVTRNEEHMEGVNSSSTREVLQPLDPSNLIKRNGGVFNKKGRLSSRRKGGNLSLSLGDRDGPKSKGGASFLHKRASKLRLERANSDVKLEDMHGYSLSEKIRITRITNGIFRAQLDSDASSSRLGRPVVPLRSRLKVGVSGSYLGYTPSSLKAQSQIDAVKRNESCSQVVASVLIKPFHENPGAPGGPPQHALVGGNCEKSKDGIIPGDEGKNEAVAHAVDGGRFGTPLTWVTSMSSDQFYYTDQVIDLEPKGVSMQEWKTNSRTFAALSREEKVQIMVNPAFQAQIRGIASLDMLTYNSDRTPFNIIFHKKHGFSPIDNSCIASMGMLSPVTFAWLSWPMAQEVFDRPFTAEEKDCIFSRPFDVIRDVINERMNRYKYDNGYIETLELSDLFYKTCVSEGLTQYQIACLYTRSDVFFDSLIKQTRDAVFCNENGSKSHGEKRLAFAERTREVCDTMKCFVEEKNGAAYRDREVHDYFFKMIAK